MFNPFFFRKVTIFSLAVFFILWRKLKKKVSKTLGIDENANKEVEEELVIKEDEEGK